MAVIRKYDRRKTARVSFYVRPGEEEIFDILDAIPNGMIGQTVKEALVAYMGESVKRGRGASTRSSAGARREKPRGRTVEAPPHAEPDPKPIPTAGPEIVSGVTGDDDRESLSEEELILLNIS